MIIIVKPETKKERVNDLIHWIESQNLRTHLSTGDYSTIIGVIGDTSKLDSDLIRGLDIVENVKRVSEPYKNANRKFHPQDSVIQVGARNMQNFELLKELGHTRKPILLKRGLANTLQELLMSAEYIMAGGNENVILCERGIRTFETATRNTLDLSAVAALHEMTHLPVIVDPSHATGVARYVKPMAMAAAACGADGLIIEVHNDPPHALCDGAQSLRPEQFVEVSKAVNAIRATVAGLDEQ